MVNCVLTQHSTVTPCRAIASQVAAAVNRSRMTAVAPRWIGVVWLVQIPKPNGVGMTGRKTSSGASIPFATAFWWK